MADDNNKVIISRIQNRRGLKQDLPQPLRPGELGFATDTRQVFIGADPTDAISGGYNKQSIFETTVGAKDFTSSIANNNIIAFTVPFKKYGKGYFDGIGKVVSFLPSSNTTTSSSLSVFPSNTLVTTTAIPNANVTSNVITLSEEPNAYITVGDIVTGDDVLAFTTVEEVNRTANTVTLSANIVATTSNVLTFIPNNLLNAETNLPFKAADLIVAKNGIRIPGDSSNSTPAAAYEYSFAANTSASNTHIVTFRTAPLATEEVTICYYSNTAIIQAIEGITTQGYEGNISLYNVGEKRFDSFYKAYSIPAYRQIPTELITVSTTTGTGLIGLQNKHIAVNADSGEIDSPTSLTLGNLLVSRSDWRHLGSSVTVNPSNLVFAVGSVPSYDPAGPYNYIYVDQGDTGYLNQKVFQISSATSSTVTVDLPSNAFQVARSVSATADGAGANVTVTLTGNVDGVSSGANILIVDGANTSGLNGEVVIVENDPATGVIVFNTNTASFLSNASVQFINYGDDATGTTKVQLFSALHGYTAVDDVDITSSTNTSAINNATYTVDDVTSLNTLFITPTSAVTGQVTGELSPNLTSGTANVTPVRSIDLSSNTTLAEISSTVNDIEDWPYLGIIPDSENKIYITHKPEYTSVGINFRLHEDYSQPTLSVLSLTEGEYTTDSTVKAKLEKWLNSCLESDLVDVFSSASAGVKYATDAATVRSLGTYLADINNTYDEITFTSREEARDFNKIVNQIFFERPDPDNENIKGLVNLKTNIELQTRSSIALGDRTVSYAELNSASIPAAGGNISSLTQSIDVYDTYKIDYSITESSSVTVSGENYQRVGTMFVSGRSEFNAGSGAVLFQDMASEMVDIGLTGNVTFNVSLVGTDIIFNVTNNVGRDLSMKYIVKRWSSL